MRVQLHSNGRGFFRRVTLLLVTAIVSYPTGVQAAGVSASIDVHNFSTGEEIHIVSPDPLHPDVRPAVAAGGSAFAIANYRVLGASATMRADSPDGRGPHNSAIASAAFSDEWRFDRPPGPGKFGNGTTTVLFQTDGHVSALSSNRAIASAIVSYLWKSGNQLATVTRHGEYGIDGHFNEFGPNFIGQPIAVTFPFSFGSTTSISLAMTISVSVNATHPDPDHFARATADFGHTLKWLGIGEVRDSDGNLVTDYTLTSASGTDYTQAVPEPSALALVGLALVSLGGYRRQKRFA